MNDNSNLPKNFSDAVKGRFSEKGFCGASVGRGWIKIVNDLDIELSKIMPEYKIVQIKEKFGGLRYYIRSDDKVETHIEAQKYIVLAEEKAEKTCEICGVEGKISSNNRGWVKTRCDIHKYRQQIEMRG